MSLAAEDGNDYMLPEQQREFHPPSRLFGSCVLPLPKNNPVLVPEHVLSFSFCSSDAQPANW
jgi:hypothetical protein